ncbi:aquaporin-8-like [Leguminivora glycinivorella]|uniref:aquaporin-8-like n=1 Tax=Leguminivora glycinivorella TaxID=1035111 RepID=UPI00200BD5EE|nr:aquaporin-8-like [Leguminivora glycinivorella]XP_047988725.1 aquaporin-8-like [Leguminivora glycinivorella]XP_047988726.1 aquaporin-8-like [Leguminivora glycinivorella]
MPRNDEVKGVSGAIRVYWRAVLTELVATALLVLLGIASLVPKISAADTLIPPPLAHPALAFGFVVLCLAQAFGEVSGAHMNPAITVASTLLGRTPIVLALAYSIAQMLGATLGYAALFAITPKRIYNELPALGVTMPANGFDPAAAAVVEAVITGLLTLLACALWTGKPDPAGPIKFGLVVAGLVYAGGEMTGASLNPARSFGPALVTGHWEYQWVYWVGPLGGAVLFALLHKYVLVPQAHKPPPPTREELPLNDKNNC